MGLATVQLFGEYHIKFLPAYGRNDRIGDLFFETNNCSLLYYCTAISISVSEWKNMTLQAAVLERASDMLETMVQFQFLTIRHGTHHEVVILFKNAVLYLFSVIL